MNATVAQTQDRSVAPLLARFRELGILFFLLLFVILATAVTPRFLSAFNIRTIALDLPLLTVVAMGQTMVIISRNIDLSVGSILGFTGMAVGLMFKSNPDFPVLLGVTLGVLIGLALGVFNGVLVAWLRTPAIIATLGTLSIYRGLAFVISGGRQVDPNDVPVALIDLVKPSPLRVQWLVLIAAAIVIVVAVFLRRTRMGREIYAVGSNPDAARLRGIPVRRITLLVFAVSGMLSGAAGVMYASRFGFVNPGQTGVGFELQVIAATVIGGTNIFGGSGTALGTMIGCLFLVVINNGLTVMGVSGFWQLAVYGVMILLALILDAEVRRRLERPSTRRGAA